MMRNIIRTTAIIGFCIGTVGCAHSPLKAPCGPTAGLTDPCGNRIPINGVKQAKVDVETDIVFLVAKVL